MIEHTHAPTAQPPTQHPATSRLIDEPALIELTGLSRVTLWRLRKAGTLPFRKVGSRILYAPADVQTFLNNTAVNGTAAQAA